MAPLTPDDPTEASRALTASVPTPDTDWLFSTWTGDGGGRLDGSGRLDDGLQLDGGRRLPDLPGMPTGQRTRAYGNSPTDAIG